MSLIKCQECGKEISDKATTCIGCGAPVVNLYSYKPKLETFFCLDGDKEMGPYTRDELNKKLSDGFFHKKILCAKPGMDKWIPINEIISSGLTPEGQRMLDMRIAKKKCPFCAEEISIESIKCKFCGSAMPKQIPKNDAFNPLLVAMASGCCIAGLGQMSLGQVGKGLVLMLSCIVIAAVTGGMAMIILWPIIGIDAYLVAKKLNTGQPVGAWEFFP